MALRPYYWLYGWALVPSLALAAESALHLESADSFVSLLVQWGLGALVGVVAVRMMLVLYKDKEESTHDYHAQLLELTREQITAIRDTKVALEKVEGALENHNREFRRFLDEMQRLVR